MIACWPSNETNEQALQNVSTEETLRHLGGVIYVATSAMIFELDISVLVSFKSLAMVSVNYITVKFARVVRVWLSHVPMVERRT